MCAACPDLAFVLRHRGKKSGFRVTCHIHVVSMGEFHYVALVAVLNGKGKRFLSVRLVPFLLRLDHFSQHHVFVVPCFLLFCPAFARFFGLKRAHFCPFTCCVCFGILLLGNGATCMEKRGVVHGMVSMFMFKCDFHCNVDN
jgi:hypothetical protein